MHLIIFKILIIILLTALLGAYLALKTKESKKIKENSLSPYILLLIRSIHSIERISQSFIIAIAVLAHKGSASFALVVDMLKNHMSEISIAFFDALAAGTFLYIAIMEIFDEEFNQTQHTKLKLLISTITHGTLAIV